MDWTMFLFGAVAGALFATLALAFIGVRVMRPFMRAARKRATSADSVTPPINWDSTSNNPDFVWPQAKKGKDGN